MVKQGNLLSKTLVIGIIFLFIIMSIIPSMAVNTENIKHENGKSSSDDIDWWPMFHHDLVHSGYSTSHAPDTNKILWSRQLGERTSSPAVVDGRVYIGSRSQIGGGAHCLDANTGAKIWSYKEYSDVWCTPAVVDGRVYINIAHQVFCLDAISGGYIWRYGSKGLFDFSSPMVVDGKVYVGSWYEGIFCLDANTGDYIWSYKTDEHMDSSPTIADGKVYIGSDDYNVYCLDANTGDYIWSYKTGEEVISSPAVADGKVYIGSDDDNVYCLDANTGAKIWSYKTGSAVSSSPAVAGGKLFIGSFDRNVYCLDANNGSKIWSYKTGARVESSPAVADGKVYIASFDHNVYCLNANNGSKIWSYKTTDNVKSSPAVADGKVYIGGDGNVYAFGELDPDAPTTPEINGPTGGVPNIMYNFTFKSESPVGNDLFYWIEWADGSNSGWLGPYDSGVNITESHVWDATGVYAVQARAKDTNGSVSSWGIRQLNIPRNRGKNYSLFQLLLYKFPLLEVFLRAMNLLR